MAAPPPQPAYQVLALNPAPAFVALTAGPHIHLHSLAPPAFAPLASTSALPPADQHASLVRTTAVSADGSWLASSCDGKELRVWHVADGGRTLRLSSVRKLLKKVAAMQFNAANDIVFGDKLGDAYTYPLHPVPASEDLATQRTVFEVSGDPSLNPDGTLLLGHTSPLTSLALVGGPSAGDAAAAYVVTSDRDEHVRVSRYPDGFVAERFLAGHTKFVSSVAVLAREGRGAGKLVSGGGDRELYVWDVREGTCVAKVPVAEEVGKHIVVRGTKRRMLLPDAPPPAAPAPAAVAVAAAASEEEQAAAGEAVVEETVNLDADSAPLPAAAAGGDGDAAGEDDAGLAVMGLTEVAGRVAFFSLGATALFTAPLPLTADSRITAVDIGFPVLAFAPLPAPPSSAEETLVLVSYDATHAPASSSSSSSSAAAAAAAAGLALVALPADASAPATVVGSHALLAALRASPALSLAPPPAAAPPPGGPGASRKARAAASQPVPLAPARWALYQALTDLPKAPTEVPLVPVGGGGGSGAAGEPGGGEGPRASKKEVERRKRNGGVETRQSYFPGKKRRKGEETGAAAGGTPVA